MTRTQLAIMVANERRTVLYPFGELQPYATLADAEAARWAFGREGALVACLRLPKPLGSVGAN